MNEAANLAQTGFCPREATGGGEACPSQSELYKATDRGGSPFDFRPGALVIYIYICILFAGISWKYGVGNMEEPFPPQQVDDLLFELFLLVPGGPPGFLGSGGGCPFNPQKLRAAQLCRQMGVFVIV